ncbi:alpha/beta hydrolase [Marispirochaeta aestuarii]|uniref:alpha/beta hydrolase n=1 Tax=Marispirochaeta aestuarii TaxID=1963862 RepID=UPI002ABE50C9|nr:alpha/beta hydrolase [Marispirochaeta aestuarii]
MRLTYKVLISVFIAFLFFNCKTTNNLYRGIEEIRINYSDTVSSFIYPIYRKPNNNTVIIVIGGSGYSSVLGSKICGFSTGYSTAGLLNLGFSNEYDLLILEKPNLKPFENGDGKINLLQIYTVEDLSTIYAKIIDYFIFNSNYDNIILFGHSEGGRLVPAIYNKTFTKDELDKLIISGSGAISQEEQLRLLIEHGVIEGISIEKFDQKISEIYNNPNSLDLFWWNHPYIRWASFLKYEYLSDLEKINIPILIVHGTNDKSVPVESIRVVFDEHRSKNNITYYEMEGGHGVVFNNLEKVEEWIVIE